MGREKGVFRTVEQELQSLRRQLETDTALQVSTVHKVTFDVVRSMSLRLRDKWRLFRYLGRSGDATGFTEKEARENLRALILKTIGEGAPEGEGKGRHEQGPATQGSSGSYPNILKPPKRADQERIFLRVGNSVIPLEELAEPLFGWEAKFDVEASQFLTEREKKHVTTRLKASTIVEFDPIKDNALKSLTRKLDKSLGTMNPVWQALSLWGPAIFALVAAGLLGIADIPKLDTDDLRRLASLCASLLIAGLAGTGIVAAFGLKTVTASSATSSENDQGIPRTGPAQSTRLGNRGVSKMMRWSQFGAGVGILVSLLLTCSAIVAGGLATPSSLANFICISGLIAAVLQIFAGPISLAVARLGDKPFLLDELAT